MDNEKTRSNGQKIKQANSKPDRSSAARDYGALLIYGGLFLALSVITLLRGVIFQSGNFRLFTSSLIFTILALFLITFVYAMCTAVSQRKSEGYNKLGVQCVCIAVAYAASMFAHRISPYLMPTFLTAFLLAPLVKRRDVFIASLFCNIMIITTLLVELVTVGIAPASNPTSIYVSPQIITASVAPLVMFLVGIFSGSITAFGLTYESRRFEYILKGAAICIASIALILSFQMIAHGIVASIPAAGDVPASYIPRGILFALLWGSIAVFAQLVLSIFLQPLFEKIFNLLTNARLMDLTDHNFPLIKRLITETPGTFNHALNVANFAEVCATAIGDNPYLARACAYYHDIGKLSNPHFFKENQSGENPHDAVLPEVSAEIIRNHAVSGLELCRQYRIPEEIALVSAEHHGNMPISMFLDKAQRLTDGEVDIKEYSYRGPTPTTKISAIIMICDTAEAALRAESMEAEQAEELLTALIRQRIQSGQFDRCDITLSELTIIKDTILSAYSGVYHKRLKYPEGK